MQVKVRVYSTLRRVVGSSSFSIKLEEGATLQDFMNEFSTKYGEAFQERTKRDLNHALKRRFNIFVNRQSTRLPEHLNLELKNDDEIVILQPVGGG